MFYAKSREEIEEFLNKDTHLRYILEAATGSGKTYMSILKMRQWKRQFGGKFLVVIPKLVLIDNWKTEFKKFDAGHLIEDVVFSTYVSLHKHAEQEWTGIILDEAHHLSDRCKDVFAKMDYKCFIALSATLKREVKDFLYYNVRGLETIRMTLKDAIDNNVVPNPKVILIPLVLNNRVISEVVVKNPKAKKSMEVGWQDRFKCNNRNIRYNIHCTPAQWYEYYTKSIEWMKDKQEMRNAYLMKCGIRLKWLSNQKTDFVKEILKHITKHRVITFCNSIEQSNNLGRNSINSKNGVAQDVLDAFNRKEISKVTCVEIITEGVNVSDCRIGVFATLNASQTLQVQKSGRILRHPKPVIIIPYYINTRDEQLVVKMIQNYDQDMIVRLTDLNELKEHLK